MPTLRKHQGRQLEENKFGTVRKMCPLKPWKYYTEPKHAVLDKGTNMNNGALPDSMRVTCAVNCAFNAFPSADKARTCTVSVLYKLQNQIPQACLPSKEPAWGFKIYRTNERTPKPTSLV